jgi:pyruvate formate lyase activating enzyme
MPFYKLTYAEPYKRATVHNLGCNFRCVGCAYKLKGRPTPERIPSLDEFKAQLAELDRERVHFMGGEPTTNPDLPEMLRFCKQELGVFTMLGHTNGSHIPTQNLDGANVSFKAFSADKHLEYTGQPAQPVYDSFRAAFDRGVQMKASCVYIPGYIDLDEIEPMLGFVAGLSPDIPFHIMGYIPVPGTPWRRPTEEEMAGVLALAQQYLKQVGSSHLTSEQARDLTARDERFHVVQVL